MPSMASGLDRYFLNRHGVITGGGQLMTHPNALLTPRARLRLARLIVEDGYPATIAAKMGSFAGEGEILR